MKKVCLFILFALSLSCSLSARAQLLDDDFPSNQNTTDNSDALFGEIFDDFSETEKDITKVKTFDEAVDVFAEEIKKNTPADNTPVQESFQITPLKGEMFIGIQKNSFRIFRDMSGQSRCSFSVTLKSDLEKDIKLLALNLVYTKKVFAFVFKDVPAGKMQLRHITTGGDICYRMAGIVPDINIHKCKIRATLAKDCAEHIKWSDDLE